MLPSFCLAIIDDLAGRSHDLNSTMLSQYLQFTPAGAQSLDLPLAFPAWHPVTALTCSLQTRPLHSCAKSLQQCYIVTQAMHGALLRRDSLF